MLNRLLSGDYPRSKVLAVILVAVLLGLAFAPFLFPGVKALSVAAKVLIFVVLVASFDLLLGYTGIVSFAHTMFFGIGAYGIAVATTRMGPTWSALAVGVGGALLLSLMLALWLRYNGPDTSLSFEIMMDCLLIVVIGGMGTIYGSAIGAVLFVVAQSYLQDLLRLGHEAATGLPWLSALLSPDRWLLWLGVLFVLSVYYFPTGVVGRLRAAAAHRPA